MEEPLPVTPLPSKVLQSFIDSESDETGAQDVIFSSPDTKHNLNALVTLRRGLQPSSSSSCLSSFQSANGEESLKKLPSGICTLSRKAPIRRISIGNQFAKHERQNHVLTKSLSETANSMPTAYNPNEPLTRHPIKQQMPTDHLQSVDNYFTRTKSIMVTIGPLTKEVCGKLNISWENSDPCVSPQDTKVTITMHALSCASLGVCDNRLTITTTCIDYTTTTRTHT